ncbi:MAG: hypothetical protein AB7O47_12110 [Flavobacteriales bacterium]
MKKIFSAILSLVILFTSMGFTLSSHICGGKKVKTVLDLGVSDVSCGMEKTESKCQTDKQMKSNCCQDEFQKIQINDSYTQEFIKEKIITSNYVLLFVAVLFDFFPNENIQSFIYKDYIPPPLIKDIPVFFQSFLI